jgi:hypothetical protein
MTRFWMPPQTAPLANDLGIFLRQCPKNSLISAWPPVRNAEPASAETLADPVLRTVGGAVN